MTIRILVVGLGRMGLAHASSYHRNEGFEIVGLVSPSALSKVLPAELEAYPRFETFAEALAATQPDAVSINSYPDTHAAYAIQAMEAGAHVFLEKPLATTLEDAARVVEVARARNRKLVLGYILRVHPSWITFIDLSQTLGKPLAMRFSLNQQSFGAAWHWHRNLIDSVLPIVDCGVHYVDVMCQMTRSKPLRVHGIGAALWGETDAMNYGHLHVTFEDGSVGWYETGWGPMMSKTAIFVKDVVGPKGAVSLLTKNEAEGEGAKTDMLLLHHAEVGPDKAFARADERIAIEDAPDQQELCDREQAFFLKAIVEDLDLTEMMAAAVHSLRIVLAAEQSMKEERVIHLD